MRIHLDGREHQGDLPFPYDDFIIIECNPISSTFSIHSVSTQLRSERFSSYPRENQKSLIVFSHNQKPIHDGSSRSVNTVIVAVTTKKTIRNDGRHIGRTRFWSIDDRLSGRKTFR